MAVCTRMRNRCPSRQLVRQMTLVSFPSDVSSQCIIIKIFILTGKITEDKITGLINEIKHNTCLACINEKWEVIILRQNQKWIFFFFCQFNLLHTLYIFPSNKWNRKWILLVKATKHHRRMKVTSFHYTLHLYRSMFNCSRSKMNALP